MTLRIQVNAYGIDQAITSLKGTPKKLERAQSRAINRTLQSVQTQLLRAVSKETGISQRWLKQYQRVKMRKSTFKSWLNGEFWMGLDPMPAETAKGAARQEDWGVKKGNYLFEGAFYRAVYGSQPKIWFRKGSRGDRKNPRYHRRRSSKNSAWQRQNSGRFPVARAGIAIDKPASLAFQSQRGEIRNGFQKRLLHEINWELSK